MSSLLSADLILLLYFKRWSVDFDELSSETSAEVTSTASSTERTTLFDLVPVDQFGDNIKGEGILKDKGKSCYTIS